MGMTNWASNLTYRADGLRFPESVSDVQELVAHHAKVKALGTRHSFTDIADSPGGVLISLDRLPARLTIGEDSRTATVAAGTPYGVVAAELESLGLALANLGSLPHISVGGATATATHGSGNTNGVLSSSVAAVELVLADGSLKRIDRSSSDLNALAVALGAFGIITKLDLDVQPSYRVRQDIYRHAEWDEVVASFDEVMASAYSVCLIGDIGGRHLDTLWLKQRLEAGDGSAPASMCGGTWTDDADLPPDHALTVRGGIPGPWSERLAHFRLDAPPSAGGDELQTEYFVAREHSPAAIQILRAMGDRISPHLHAMEIRTVAADELWMSPAYQRPCVSLGFTWRKHPGEVLALLPDIEAALAQFEPRPHWGKLFAMRHLGDRFPRLDDFVELAHGYDPERKFWNPFLDRLVNNRR